MATDHYGSPDTLQRCDLPQPTPKVGQVLIEVYAAGINPLDWKQLAGQLRAFQRPAWPLVPGHDVAGRIAALGPDVSGWQVGDEVCCMLDGYPRPAWHGFALGGGYAEFAVTRASTLARKPAALPWAQAAALPLAGLTALQALTDVAQLQAGQRVLINGAAGGVGVFALQLATVLGAEVIAVARAEQADALHALGAAQVLDYRRFDVAAMPKGLSLIYDMASVLTLPQCRAGLLQGGMLLSNLPSLASFCAPLRERLGLTQQRLRHAWVRPDGSALQRLLDLYSEGQLQIPLAAQYPLSEARAAMQAACRGGVLGKHSLQVV
ncbi:NADP-dependent oxidoreductase [Atopomonas sediminilitoris]|uniref:NADP-dependent oxidoreductase n=1 Tax=Atopomonas sediminilitoris TaxID=2919919 RepID=UPI001F4E752C|nr:NADP-dependent oxidoreductase [Atopomonas sediminilitoris]MCJ8168160.1 NADP-dependent oxidoreductase [Atopomonas sediminilitoris]